MAIGKMQRYAKVASRREVEILDSLKEYYRGKWSLGRAAEAANIPTRALMDYMQKHKLPYYSDRSDSEDGLKKVSEIRSVH
jgi:hypothetical protein